MYHVISNISINFIDPKMKWKSFGTLAQVFKPKHFKQTMTLSKSVKIICSFLLSYIPFSKACDISTTIVNDWNIANHLNDWTLCYYQPYKDITTTSDLTACPTEAGYYIFVGAKATQVTNSVIHAYYNKP